MPSLVPLVGNAPAKLAFARSLEYIDCLNELGEGGASGGRALSVLTLAAREPAVARQLRRDLEAAHAGESLDGLIEGHALSVLRLIDATGLAPSPRVRAEMGRLLNQQSPSINEVRGAQLASGICSRHGIKFELQLARHPPHYVAAQVVAATSLSEPQLWRLVRSTHAPLRLAAISALTGYTIPAASLVPLLADLLPLPEACAVAAKLVDASTAATLVDAGTLSKLLEAPSSESLLLAEALVLRAIPPSGLVPAVVDLLGVLPNESLRLLAALTRHVLTVRECVGLAPRIVELVETAPRETAGWAMSVASNLCIGVSPCCAAVLPLYKVATERFDDPPSLQFLVQATVSAPAALKDAIFSWLGVARLVAASSSQNGLSLVSNLLCRNPSAVQVWLSEAPLDLWALVDTGLKRDPARTLVLLVNVAASRADAILARPNLLIRVAQVLEGAPVEGLLLLSNLYERGPAAPIFRRFLSTCSDPALAARAKCFW